MHVSVKWFDGKYPSFNINLHKAEGQPEFLSIKGCRLVNGRDGEFVSMPSTKGNNDKYWNHAWADEKFSAHVLKLAQEGKPQGSGKPKSESFDDVPF